MIQVESIGTRRELFVDDALIHSTTARLALQKPERKEAVFRFEAPFEGSGNGYPVLIKDGELFRLFYKAAYLTSEDGKEIYIAQEDRERNPVYGCVIESKDGIRWYRPSVGEIECNGSKDNNIVLHIPELDAFIPFLDTNPACPPEARYKALVATWKKLYAYQSPDGYRWTPMGDGQLPIEGTFDSSNLAFWDTTRNRYWAYVRNFHNVPGEDYNVGIRDISWSESADFLSWSKSELLDFGSGPDIPLYVSAITPYYRAPHLFVGFPARYVEHPAWSPSFDQLPDPEHRRNRMAHHPRYGLALTDCAFMSSRDGKTWRRTDEAFVRPGMNRTTNWSYGDSFLSIGMAETKSAFAGSPDDISLYAIANYWKGPMELHRYTIRQDGFMALSADAKGHETLTKPFLFAGAKLSLNVSTAAVGGMKVELQDISGNAIEGYTLADCDPIFGDRLDYMVSWNGSSDVSALAGKAVRMRLHMNDTDLYSFRFEE